MSRICYVRHKYYPNATPTRRNAEAADAYRQYIDFFTEQSLKIFC